MNSKSKNLIFQFLLELEEGKAEKEICAEEKKLMEKLHYTEEKYKVSGEIITEIKELFIILKSEIKFKYFEYGIIANQITETTNII